MKQLLDSDPDVHLRPISLWEIGIKRGMGKLSGRDDLIGRVRNAGFGELPVRTQLAATAGRTQLLHRDLDRMLIGQASCEGLTLLTSDAGIAQYEVPDRSSGA